jgi:hypothetical protein
MNAPLARWIAALAVPVAVGALWLLSSCGFEELSEVPTYEIGAVEGYVLEAGRGAAVEVVAKALIEVPEQSWSTSTTSDSTGWYRLEIPSGRYLLKTVPEFDGYYSGSAYDTIQVAHEVLRYDLRRGRAEIDIAMAEALEGQSFDFRLFPRGGASALCHAEVSAGELHVVVPLVPAGDYFMSLDFTGGSRFGGIYLPGTYDLDTAGYLTVDVDQITTYQADISSEYASISGEVVGSWLDFGDESSHPQIEAFFAKDRRFAGCYCEDDGSFRLGLLCPVPTRLRVFYKGIEQWIGGTSYETASLFAVEPGGRITGVSVVESSLKIWLDGPGEIIRHQATVMIRDAAGDGFEDSIVGSSPTLVANLRQGSYRVYVSGSCWDQTWSPQWYDGAASLEDATVIELEAGQRREIVISLFEGGRIEGTVLDYDGSPPEYAECSAYNSNGEALCYQADRFAGGAFELTGLADGDYYVGARLHNLVWWYPGTFSLEEAILIRIQDHSTVSGLVWSLPQQVKDNRP